MRRAMYRRTDTDVAGCVLCRCWTLSTPRRAPGSAWRCRALSSWAYPTPLSQRRVVIGPTRREPGEPGCSFCREWEGQPLGLCET